MLCSDYAGFARSKFEIDFEEKNNEWSDYNLTHKLCTQSYQIPTCLNKGNLYLEIGKFIIVNKYEEIIKQKICINREILSLAK